MVNESCWPVSISNHFASDDSCDSQNLGFMRTGKTTSPG
jgi:hypothetical protein